MKKGVFKHLFLLIITIILIYIFYIVNQTEEEKKNYEEPRGNVESNQNTIREMRIGISQIDTFNPLYSLNINIQNISKIIYEPLFEITEDFRVEPRLGTEFAKINSLEYVVKIRENVKWSDGERLTSEDIIFTYENLKTINSIYTTNVKAISKIEKVDDYTVKFILSSEQSFFEYNLNVPIMSKEYYQDKEFSDINLVPVSSGMYAPTGVTGSTIILEKNENYWDRTKVLNLNQININMYDTAGEVYNSMKLGNTDVISTQNENVKTYIGEIGYNFQEIKGRTQDYLVMNTKSELISNLEVRKAIASMIDKNSIALNVYSNNVIISNFPLDYGSYLYKSIDTVNKYDLQYANQVLSEQGWQKSSNIWQKSENGITTKLEVNMLVNANEQQKLDAAINIRNQLEIEGIRVNIIEARDNYYDLLYEKNYDIAFCSINLGVSPSMETFFGDNNLAQYESSEVTTLINEVKNTTDETRLIEIYQSLNEKYIEEVPYISLYNQKQMVVYNKALVGEFKPNWYNSYYKIDTWYK